MSLRSQSFLCLPLLLIPMEEVCSSRKAKPPGAVQLPPAGTGPGALQGAEATCSSVLSTSVLWFIVVTKTPSLQLTDVHWMVAFSADIPHHLCGDTHAALFSPSDVTICLWTQSVTHDHNLWTTSYRVAVSCRLLLAIHAGSCWDSWRCPGCPCSIPNTSPFLFLLHGKVKMSHPLSPGDIGDPFPCHRDDPRAWAFFHKQP